jgi:hypothetical protein
VRRPAFKCLPCDLHGHYEQDEVDQHGQGDARFHAHQEPEWAPSSHPLSVFHLVGHDLRAIFISNITSSETAPR